MSLAVLRAGFQTTVQDCGRFRFQKFGVSIGGALDSAALRILNLLVGNEECAAGLEIVNGRVRLQFSDYRLAAWSGGDFDVRIESLPVPQLHCARISAGQVCDIAPKRGRAWFALSGGIDVPEILGSRSTDLRARFGGFEGRALRDGDKLPLGSPSAAVGRIAEQMGDSIADWSGPVLTSRTKKTAGEAVSFPSERKATGLASAGETDSPYSESTTLRIIPGKNLTEETGAKFLATRFRVAMNSDRMGLRLEGAPIQSGNALELVSEPVVPGTIQLPPGGSPIVLLADCQTIGGYPKIAHVITVDLARAVQLQPMDQVCFELTTHVFARKALRERERDIALFRAGLEVRFG